MSIIDDDRVVAFDAAKIVRVWWDGGEVVGFIGQVEPFDVLDDKHYNWYVDYPIGLPRWLHDAKFDVHCADGSVVTVDPRTVEKFRISNI